MVTIWWVIMGVLNNDCPYIYFTYLRGIDVIKLSLVSPICSAEKSFASTIRILIISYLFEKYPDKELMTNPYKYADIFMLRLLYSNDPVLQ